MIREKIHKPTIIILDKVQHRCLRQEAALDKAIEDKGIYAFGMSNYGKGYIARSGVPAEKLPCIQIDGLYFFPPLPNEELTYDKICRFLDILTANGALQLTVDVEGGTLKDHRR